MAEHLSLSPDAMALMMPMHVWLSPDGRIRRVGPTLQKLRPNRLLAGRGFFDIFEIRRPKTATDMGGLMGVSDPRIQLAFRDAPTAGFKGLATRLEGGQGMLIDLSFGISVIEAVGKYGLTSADFAATDLTVEMLYLVEAKAAVLEESRKLNKRLQGAKIAAEEQAFTDTLTGLKNRRAMDHVLGRLCDGSFAFGVMNIDLDYFKDVNDTLGHAAGDHVLQNAARILVTETRKEDTVVRSGGDEFVIIFPNLTDPDRLGQIANRIISRLEQPIMYEGTPCRISGSIGTAISKIGNALDVDDILHAADMALYESKRAGRARMTLAQIS